MPRLFRKSQRYSVSRISWLAKIMLLDGTIIDINLQPDVTGADCLERVSQCMSITEIDYFGLQYDCKAGYKRWVDRDKSLRKQLDKHHVSGAKNAELNFSVQFYVTNVTKLEFEVTRYLYFLQLKHSVLEGEMRCTNEIACKLASYALQAEFADYDEQKHTPSFLQEFVLFPPSIDPSPSDTVHERVLRLYQRHRGMSAAAAELMYIKLAQQLAEYGHEPLQQLESSGTRIWLGACFIGIFIKHSNGQPTVYFKWPEILRMKVKDRHFGIETHQESIYFKMIDGSTAQYVLRMMVLQHRFFQTEYQGLGVKWSTAKPAKKKSASLHDISTHALHSSKKKKKSRSINLETASEIRASNFSRPLGRHQKDNLIDPLSPVTSISPRYDDVTSLPERIDMGVAITSPTESVGDKSTYHTTAGWINNTPERKKEKIKGLGRTGVIEKIPVQEDSIDIGHDLTLESVGSMDDTSREHSLEPLEDHVKLPNGNGIHHQYTSSDVSGGSQGSVEFYAHPRNHSLEGSRTPPTAKHYSTDDQWEQEATSGARDQRGQRLERILASSRVYSEFEEIPKVTLSAEIAGSSPNNVRKNRYREIVPYEKNRVHLDPSRNVGQSDYINASYVNFTVGNQCYKYIVAQGPLEHTCGDFWQMIWEKETKIVLMLSNEVEDGKVKCHKYFPNDNTESFIQFEQYRISLKFVNKSLTTISRGLNIKYIPTGEEREIMHMQYIDWPSHDGTPEDTQSFLEYLKAVQALRQKYDPKIPIVAHCSLGVGRSGVLVLTDMLTITYDTGQAIDIPSSLQSLRQQRMHLVETLGQYKFVYSILIQYIKNARLI